MWCQSACINFTSFQFVFHGAEADWHLPVASLPSLREHSWNKDSHQAHLLTVCPSVQSLQLSKEYKLTCWMQMSSRSLHQRQVLHLISLIDLLLWSQLVKYQQVQSVPMSSAWLLPDLSNQLPQTLILHTQRSHTSCLWVGLSHISLLLLLISGP